MARDWMTLYFVAITLAKLDPSLWHVDIDADVRALDAPVPFTNAA